MARAGRDPWLLGQANGHHLLYAMEVVQIQRAAATATTLAARDGQRPVAGVGRNL
jgi:hypothetical protein